MSFPASMTHLHSARRWLSASFRLVLGAYIVAILAAVVVYKCMLAGARGDLYFEIYGIVVTTYLVSRFALSLLYRAPPDAGLEPRVAIVMPAFNEEAAVATSLRSLLAVDYPGDKLELVAINDGSSDNTLGEMQQVAVECGGRIRVINFPENRGKRAAMAAGIRATDAEIIAFVDSDSSLVSDALRKLVQGFADDRVGAVCGHADVLNVRANWLTKMQAVRYFVAFKVCKAAEGVFGAVTCCSGCFSAYRREAIMPKLDWWENQTFFGRPSTFGDDRSLTNCVLRNWRVLYHAEAVAETIVPEKLRQFIKQQTRWKRSWTRESLIVGRFVWRKHPIVAISVYISLVLPLIAPVTALRAIVWRPLIAGGDAPWIYLVGIYSMALVYSLYFALRKRSYDTLWVFGILFVFFYVFFMLWQTYYAVLTSRSSAWGTRSGGGVTGTTPPPAETVA
jgi:hyaluronan synthase